MKIYHKLALWFFTTSLIVAATTCITLLTNRGIQYDLAQINQSSIPEVESATEMVFTLQAIQTVTGELLTEKYKRLVEAKYPEQSGEKLTRLQAELEREINKFEIDLAGAEKATKAGIQLNVHGYVEAEEIEEEKEELKLLAQVQAEFFEHKKLIKQYLVILAKDLNEAEKFLDTVLEPHFKNKFLPLIRAYEADAELELVSEAKEVRNSLISADTLVVSSTFATLFIALCLSRLIALSIASPIVKLKNAVTTISNKSLDTKINIASDDEVGVLANSFNRMMENLNKTTVSKVYVDNIIKSMVDTLIIVSPDAEIVMINQATLKLLGYEENELIRKPIGMVCAEATGLIVNDSVTIRKSFNSNNKISYLAKDGSKIPMSLSASVMQDDTGTTQGIICVAQDITERKQAEEALLRAKVAEAAKHVLEIEIVERKRVEEALRMSEKRLRKQNHVLVELARCETLNFGDINAALKEITKAAALTLDVEWVSAWLYNDERSKISCLNLYQRSIDSYTKGIELSAVDSPAYFQALQVERTIAAHDAQFDSRTKEFSESYLSALGITSMLDAPIWLGGRMVGVVCHEHIGATRQWALEEQNFAGSIADLVSLAMEVCERKRAEEALRESQRRLATLIDSLPGIVFSCNNDSQRSMNYLSEGCVALTEYTSEELVGSGRGSYNTIICAEDLAKVDQAIERAISTKQPYVVEYRIYTKSGQEKWLWEKGNGVFNSKGEVISLEGFITDITKRKQAEEEISSALKKEKELGELKSRFVTMTSHEFRTPLSTILSSAEILQRYHHKLTEEKKLHHLGCIQVTVKNMTQLLNDVLLIGKAEAGKLECKPTPLELVQFCRNLVEEMQITTNTHTISFYQQGECTTVDMDEKLLRHILSNLLSNAIKYSPSGGIINFDLICEQQEAIFRVQDRGIGIPATERTNLFDSFHRATNVGTISGTGLGLAIVKKSVDLHGGNISFESEVGVGTTFIVTIPLKNPLLSLSVENILQPL